MGSGYEIARGIEHVIHLGHPPSVVWKYTPRQLKGFIDLAYHRECGDRADLLSIMATAAQGAGKSITKLIKKLRAEST